MARASPDQMLRVAKVAAHHVDEGRIALGGPGRRQMADQPDRGAGNPQAKAEADGGSERAKDDNDRPLCAAEQKRFRQRAMDGRMEAGKGVTLFHQTSAPPPKEKNDRKKLEAAKAIDRPNTI